MIPTNCRFVLGSATGALQQHKQADLKNSPVSYSLPKPRKQHAESSSDSASKPNQFQPQSLEAEFGSGSAHALAQHLKPTRPRRWGLLLLGFHIRVQVRRQRFKRSGKGMLSQTSSTECCRTTSRETSAVCRRHPKPRELKTLHLNMLYLTKTGRCFSQFSSIMPIRDSEDLCCPIPSPRSINQTFRKKTQ